MVLNQAKIGSTDNILIVGLGGIGLSALTALNLTDCDDICYGYTSRKTSLAAELGVKKLFLIKNGAV